jgi:hypothetical protein
LTDTKAAIELVFRNPFEEHNDVDQPSVSYLV